MSRNVAGTIPKEFCIVIIIKNFLIANLFWQNNIARKSSKMVFLVVATPPAFGHFPYQGGNFLPTHSVVNLTGLCSYAVGSTAKRGGGCIKKIFFSKTIQSLPLLSCLLQLKFLIEYPLSLSLFWNFDIVWR